MDQTRLRLRAHAARSPAEQVERQALKNALWSFHFNGAELDLALVPSELRPVPLTDAMEAATRWNDPHAYLRRIRCLRRLHKDFLPDIGKPNAPNRKKVQDALTNTLDKRYREDLVKSCGKKFRTDLHVTDNFFSLMVPHGEQQAPSKSKPKLDKIVHVQVEGRELVDCIPYVDHPGLDPQRGRTFLFSKFNVTRPLDPALTCLLDPRGWAKCSNLFDSTYRVDITPGGDYVPHDPDPAVLDPPLGTQWRGHLYELAGVGGQAVENILRVAFTVTRTCSGKGAKRTAACVAGTCSCDITETNVKYDLYDSLSYQIGGLEFPGLMRQNYGYFRAVRNRSGTEISCRKTIRFARLTDWSTSGNAFDYGEILNYTAPAFLSLWIYDVTQIVPCCRQTKDAVQRGA